MANLEGWDYRKKITIAGSTDGAQADYTIPVTVHFGSGTDSGDDVYCSEHCATDFDDIRFTAADGTTLLSHWRESKTDSNNAVFWVKIPSIGASPATLDIYVYYGNASAETASDIQGTFIAGVDGEDPDLWKPAFANAASKLEIPCYNDGGSSANQAVHPAILDFGETGWNGHRYWMAFTPYPANQPAYENPSIVVSDNGIDWSVPSGLTNPIVQKHPSGYNADTELVYNDSTDELWLYYKHYDGTSFHLAGLKSSDGINWTDLDGNATTYGTLCITFAFEEVSYSIIKDGASSWKYWCVRANDKDMKYRTSTDGKTWSALSSVTAKDRSGNALSTFQIWHPKVRYVQEKSLYVCLAYMGAAYSTAPIMIGTSTTTTAFNFYPVPVLQPSSSGWDSASMYRPDFLYDSASDKLRVWYSARNASDIWGIGYTESDWGDVILQADAGGMSGFSSLYHRFYASNWFRFDPSTVQVAQAEKSVRISYYGQAYKDFSSIAKYDYRGRFYDPGGSSLKLLFHIGSSTAGLHIGVSTADNASNYVYLGNGVAMTSTGVARSTGWHSFRLYGDGTSGSLELDGAPVASLSSQINGVTRARVIKELNDTAYVDSLFVRSYATDEPEISAYAAEEDFTSPPDETAPVIYALSAVATGTTTATVTFTTDEGNGDAYVLLDANVTATESAILAGLSQEVTAMGEQTVNVSGLSAATSYYAHVLHKDAANNVSNILHSSQFTTDAVAVKGATITLYAGTTPKASISNIVALWWDTTTPSGAPAYSATTASTDSSGVLTLDLDADTSLDIGDSGFLLLYKLDATDHRDSLVFAGRVAVSDIS